MLSKERFEQLYQNPHSFSNEYERGVVHGMAFLADKLIWAEEYYLDARRAMNPNSMDGQENYYKHSTDMFRILNDQLQDYYSRANGYDLFNTKETEEQWKELKKKIGLPEPPPLLTEEELKEKVRKIKEKLNEN